MAKSHSVIKLQGTLDGLTFVNSRAYRDHVRAKRGTYKKADVNKAFKLESKKLVTANIPAKIFKDAIDPYRGILMGGTLWSRLVSMFRKQINDQGAFDFTKIGLFEIHKNYPFSRLLQVQPTIMADKKKSRLHVEIQYDHHPRFNRIKSIDAYQLTVIGIFPDVQKKMANTSASSSKMIRLTEAVSPFQTQLDIPKKAKCFVICIKIDGCEKGVITNAPSTMGLCAIASGII
jgi:hypothetical protein